MGSGQSVFHRFFFMFAFLFRTIAEKIEASWFASSSYFPTLSCPSSAQWTISRIATRASFASRQAIRILATKSPSPVAASASSRLNVVDPAALTSSRQMIRLGSSRTRLRGYALMIEQVNSNVRAWSANVRARSGEGWYGMPIEGANEPPGDFVPELQDWHRPDRRISNYGRRTMWRFLTLTPNSPLPTPHSQLPSHNSPLK